jgi:hypothetical protein
MQVMYACRELHSDEGWAGALGCTREGHHCPALHTLRGAATRLPQGRASLPRAAWCSCASAPGREGPGPGQLWAGAQGEGAKGRSEARIRINKRGE